MKKIVLIALFIYSQNAFAFDTLINDLSNTMSDGNNNISIEVDTKGQKNSKQSVEYERKLDSESTFHTTITDFNTSTNQKNIRGKELGIGYRHQLMHGFYFGAGTSIKEVRLNTNGASAKSTITSFFSELGYKLIVGPINLGLSYAINTNTGGVHITAGTKQNLNFNMNELNTPTIKAKAGWSF